MVPVIEIKMEFVEYGNETTNDSRMQAVTKNNMEDLYALTNQIWGIKNTCLLPMTLKQWYR